VYHNKIYTNLAFGGYENVRVCVCVCVRVNARGVYNNNNNILKMISHVNGFKTAVCTLETAIMGDRPFSDWDRKSNLHIWR